MRSYLTACRDSKLPVLLASMERYCAPFKLWVLCWDFAPKDLPENVLPITRAEFLAAHPEHERLPGPRRETINHIDTARWRLAADIIAAEGPLTYVDGDQWFFSSPDPVYAEIGNARMAVSPHRIPSAAAGRPGVTFETHRKYGLYNSGWVYFADADLAGELARACYLWSYCDVVPMPDGTSLFGDQGHLELLAKRHGAHVVDHRGLNVAPWNVHRYGLMKAAGVYVVDGSVEGDNMWPLITYHYSGLDAEQIANQEYEITARQAELLYAPYLAELERSRP